MARAPKKNDQPQTTAQSLGSLLKSARDIMRKDKGLNGDLDRLPMLTWIMFLKFLDDLELQREAEATLAGKRFRPAIEPPYRWRDWATSPQGVTGDELLAFINQEECTRPNGTRGPGLFAYLRRLTSSNGDDRRDVIATVFSGVQNRMVSGYLLRDVINKVAGIHFTATSELHTLGALYETMLREMRDAAGDSGEFYTPRPVVRFMVTVADPRLGETVLDPASGTGGFLVETYNYLAGQVKTVADRRTLQERSLFGCEPKTLPYLLCQMNLLLHGLDAPRIDPGNALRFKLTDIGEKDRVDVIVTNPPFGGEEEKGIQGNFPDDKQTAETALLFLQLIMRKLRREPTPVGRPARAAVVVPNGTLFGDGVCARIKEQLLNEFNLHTVIRLPKGVFAPYTDQETNLLFFERLGPTKEIWYYEHPLPLHRQKLKNPCYNKSEPLAFEEFEPLIRWWDNRKSSEYAWKVLSEDVAKNNYNLDIQHPRHNGEQTIRTRREVCDNMRDSLVALTKNTQELLEVMNQIDEATKPKCFHLLKSIEEVGININPETINPQRANPTGMFKYVDLASVYLNQFEGVKDIIGEEAPSRARRVIRENDVILATVRPYLCGHAIVPPELDGEICSTGFAVLRCPSNISPRFLYYMLISPRVISQYIVCMRGAHYPALNDAHVRSIVIPDMPYDDQQKIAGHLDEIHEKLLPLRVLIETFGQRIFSDLEALFPAILSDVYSAQQDAANIQ